MIKKVLIAVAVILLLGVGYFLWNKSKTASTTPGTQLTTSQESKPSSLKDLITAGVAQTCTFEKEGSKGTVYVTTGKMRGDFETTVDSKVTKNHMIVEGNTSYIWMDGEKNGFKMSFDTSASGDSNKTTTSTSGTIDPTSNLDYKCGAWMVDSTMFSLPVGVTFQEFAIPSSAPAAKSGESTAPNNTSQCAYCDSLSGDSKAQCLSALKCN